MHLDSVIRDQDNLVFPSVDHGVHIHIYDHPHPTAFGLLIYFVISWLFLGCSSPKSFSTWHSSHLRILESPSVAFLVPI